MIQLRPYQEKIVAEVRRKLKTKRRVLIQLPTGGGKTAIAAFITSNTISRGGTAWFLCHRDFLVDQTAKTWAKVGIDHSFVAAGKWFNPWTPSHIAMVNTLRNRLAKLLLAHPAPRVCVWDEAHHISAASWAAIMDMLPDTIHIGLSATPSRLDGKGLDAYFDDIVIGPSVDWLMTHNDGGECERGAGYLSDYRMFAPSAPDMAGVHTRGNDYDKQEVDAAINKSVIVGDIVGHFKRYGITDAGRYLRGVYFAHSVKRSMELADAFSMAGIKARHLDGDTSPWERKQAAVMFADGALDVLTNVDLFGEGYDLAAQAERDVTIELVGLCRPTQSVGLHLQQIGRVLRPKPEPAIILDHAGNWLRHGLPDDDREWTLKGAEKKPAPELGKCDNCLAVVSSHAVVCKHCGAQLKEKAELSGRGGREVEHADGELQEIERDAKRKSKELEELQANSVYELQDIAKRRGYPDPLAWAAYVWTLNQRRKKAKTLADQQQQAMALYE